MLSIKGKITSVEFALEKTTVDGIEKEYIEEKVDVDLPPKGFMYLRFPQQAEFMLGDEVIITIKKVKPKDD